MSVISYLLFFLCIYFHAYCSALPLSTLDKKLKKEPHFSIKTDKMSGFESLPNHFPVMNEGNRMMKTWLVAQKPRKGRMTNQNLLKAMRKDSGGASKIKPHVSVPWRVPHKKPSEKNPGFNLDYSPPKTHPPSHN